ncbi:MAG: glycerol-3-phosphate 1-O-acyltransferase PlsY [Lentisphaerae bacterium]|nr:glycerol-3-phosphate 1-O-acyltransferase PlsY [Lentisphaerota bacterium]
MNIEQIIVFAVIFAVGYLIGSIPFGFIIGKCHGIDIRQVGSGNIGATNVTRAVGKWAGKLCFALDFCKGLLPVLLLKYLVAKGWLACGVYGLGEAAMILAVVLGHMFTCFLGFKGGKGIATAVGGVAAVAPLAAISAFIVWVVVFKVSGFVSLGSIVAALSLPILAWALGFFRITAALPLSILIFFTLLALVAVWSHRSNIKRLLEGTENSFRKKSGE